MPRYLGCLALLVITTDAGASAFADDPAPCQTTVAVGRGALPGYRADVEVVMDGTVRHGRLIVTGDGGVHLEHLDERTQGWACAVIRRASGSSRGWDDRTDPVRCVWCRLGSDMALVEVHTRDASVTISRHQLLSAR